MASSPPQPITDGRRRANPHGKRYPCDYPDCHKTFTRAEHLTRHRQNHFPERIYNCSQCARRFVRADLLQRHIERHERRKTRPLIPVETPCESSVYSLHHPMFGSDSFTEAHSSMNEEFLTWLFDNYSKHDYVSVPEPVPTPDVCLLPDIIPVAFHVQPSTHLITEHCRLQILLTLDVFPDLAQHEYMGLSWLQKYLDNYWTLFAPHYSFLHPGTSTPETIQPVLLIAMLTIGAAYCQDPVPHILANSIQDKLRWIVFGCDDFKPPAKLYVMQTLLLVEIYGKLLSDRVQHEMAHVFHGALITLMRRGSSLSDSPKSPRTNQSENIHRAWEAWADAESLKRAAYFAFLLDVQHAVAFGHNLVMTACEVRLHLPFPDSLWNSPTDLEWHRLSHQSIPCPEFLHTLKLYLTYDKPPPRLHPLAHYIILHGLLSISWYMAQKDVESLGFASSGTNSSSSITNWNENWKEILARSFDVWKENSLNQPPGPFTRAGNALYRLGHMTLYINTVDLQIFCGAKRLLGKTISPSDYERSSRRILNWKASRAARLTTLHAIELLNETYSGGCNYSVRGDQTLHYGSFDGRRHLSHHFITTMEGTEYINEMRCALLSNSQIPNESNVCVEGLIQMVADSLSDGRWTISKLPCFALQADSSH